MLQLRSATRCLSHATCQLVLSAGCFLCHSLLISSIAFADDFGLSTDPLTHSAELSAAVDDQALNAIAPASADRLVAVGDAGTILLSENAGRSWHKIRNGDASNLNAIAFTTPNIGLAVGGQTGSYTRTSQAAIIRTSDGGFTWQRIATDLPRLLGLQHRNGRILAWGDYSTKHKSALFESVDGGVTWAPIRLGITHLRTAHQAQNGDTIIIARNDTAFLRNPTGAVLTLSTLQGVKSVLHTGHEWLAVGHNGLALRSLDGQVWRKIDLPIEADALTLCDWTALAQSGQSLWLGGFPGSILLYSEDLGRTWEIKKSGQRLPIKNIAFLDDARGWFTGALGSINATRNGSDWFCQRNPGRSLGVLCLAPAVTDLPWQAVVRCAWDNGIASGIHLSGTQPSANANDYLPSLRDHCIDRLGSMGLTLADSTSAIFPDTPSEQLRVSKLELLLRTWRPSVVVLGGQRGDSTWAIRANAYLDSARNRSESTANAMANYFDLPPWSIQKIVQEVPTQQAQYSERNSQLLKRLGLSVEDILLPLPLNSRPQATSGLRTNWAASRNMAARNEFLGAVSFNSEQKRSFASDELGNYQLVMGRVHLQNSLDKLLDLEAGNSDWLRSLRFIIQSLPQKDAVPTLLALTKQLAEQEQHERIQIVYDQIIENFPNTDAARYVMLDSLRLSASDEYAAWRQKILDSSKLANGVSFATTGATIGQEVRNTTAWSGSPFEPQNGNTVNSGVVSAASAIVSTPRIEPDPVAWFQALAAYNQLLPNLDSRPDVKLASFQMAWKLNDQNANNVQKLDSLINTPELSQWSKVALQEYRNAGNSLGTESLVSMAAWTEQRPVLDGRLLEPIWGAVPPMQLEGNDKRDEKSAHKNPHDATVHWAYDHRYLYLGIRCRNNIEPKTVEPQKIRTYDSNLSSTDHVEIILDVDRDYNSAIQLAVSRDGRTFDRCCGNSAYNPKWHVIVNQSPSEWVAEIAIEANYLTTNKYLTGNAWGVSVYRRQGATNVASWQHGSSQDPALYNNGLLLFLPNE